MGTDRQTDRECPEDEGHRKDQMSLRGFRRIVDGRTQQARANDHDHDEDDRGENGVRVEVEGVRMVWIENSEHLFLSPVAKKKIALGEMHTYLGLIALCCIASSAWRPTSRLGVRRNTTKVNRTTAVLPPSTNAFDIIYFGLPFGGEEDI